jgi:hypothetical protein
VVAGDVGDGDNGTGSEVFARGNGSIDVDYFLAAVTLDAPFLWATVTSTLCARGRPITDKSLCGDVTELVQQSGIYIHVSARDGVIQRLQELGVPVQPAKLSLSLVSTEVVVATETLRAALGSVGVSYVIVERIGGKVDLSLWASKVLPFVVSNSALVIDVGCNHGRRELDRDRLVYSLLPQPEQAAGEGGSDGIARDLGAQDELGGGVTAPSGGRSDALSLLQPSDTSAPAPPVLQDELGGGVTAPTGGRSDALSLLQPSDASAPAPPVLTVASVDGADEMPLLSTDPYISLFQVNSAHLPKAEHARLSATEQLERGYGYCYDPVFRHRGNGGVRRGDQQAVEDAEDADGDGAMALMEPHDRRWLHCSVDLMAVNRSHSDRHGDAVTAVDLRAVPPVLRRSLRDNGLQQPGVDAHEGARVPIQVGIQPPRIKGVMEVHQMFGEDAPAGGIAGGVNFTLEVRL